MLSKVSHDFLAITEVLDAGATILVAVSSPAFGYIIFRISHFHLHKLSGSPVPGMILTMVVAVGENTCPMVCRTMGDGGPVTWKRSQCRWVTKRLDSQGTATGTYSV